MCNVSVQGVVEADSRHCMTTKHCHDGCMRVSHITCGSDGKLYNNGCQMRRKNCGKHVYEVPAPFCLNKLYRAKGVTAGRCPIDCSKAKLKPVRLSIYCTVFYFTLLKSILLYSTLLYSNLLYSILFYSILLYSTLFYSILLYSTLL